MFQVIKVKGDWFEYAHFLDFYDGKCAMLHGHSGKFVVEIALKQDSYKPFTVDFAIVKNTLKQLDKELDHKFLVASNTVKQLNKDYSLVAATTCHGEVELKLPKANIVIVGKRSTAEAITLYGFKRIADSLVKHFNTVDYLNLFTNFVEYIKIQFFEGVDNISVLRVDRDTLSKVEQDMLF